MKTTKLYVIVSYNSINGDKVEYVTKSKRKVEDYIVTRRHERKDAFIKATSEGTLSYYSLKEKTEHVVPIKVKSSEKLKKGDFVYLTVARFKKLIDILEGFDSNGLARLSRVALTIKYSFDERDHSVFVVKKKIR